MKAPTTVMDKLAQRDIRIGVALALTAVLIIFGSGKAFGSVGSEKVAQYSCGHRCYSTSTWSTTSEYFGGYTDILIVPFQCSRPACTDNKGSIDNEIWLLDEDTASCVRTPFQQCWVEAGYLMNHNSPNEVFFWYDQRPGQNPGWGIVGPVGTIPPPLTPTVSASPTIGILPGSARPTSTVPSGDYWNKDHFMIIKDSHLTSCASGTLSTSFLIFMYNDNMRNPFGGTSSCNSMKARYIRIGQELHGSGGVTAGSATFTRNLFAVQPLNPQNVFFNYNVQTQKGPDTVSDNPPMGKWDSDPATSLDGGVFSTSCC